MSKPVLCMASLIYIWSLKFYVSSYLYDVVVHCSIMSNSWQPYRLQHARLPCPSPSPRVCMIGRYLRSLDFQEMITFR